MKMNEYEKQAKTLWGDTPAYKEYEEKTKGYTQEDHKAIADELMAIFSEFGTIKDQAADSAPARALGLGEAYGSGGEFTRNINAAAGEGAAEFAAGAIKAYCGK